MCCCCVGVDHCAELTTVTGAPRPSAWRWPHASRLISRSSPRCVQIHHNTDATAAPAHASTY